MYRSGAVAGTRHEIVRARWVQLTFRRQDDSAVECKSASYTEVQLSNPRFAILPLSVVEYQVASRRRGPWIDEPTCHLHDDYLTKAR